MSSALFYPSCILYSTLSKDPAGCRWRCRPGSLRPCTIHSTASRVPSVGQSTSSKHILRRRRAMSIRAGSTLSASSTPDSAQHHVTLPVSSVQPPNRRTQDDQAVSSGPRDSALSNGALTRSPKHPEQVLNKKTLASSSLAVDPPEPNCIFPVSPLSRSSSFLFSLARSRPATSVVLWCCCSSFLEGEKVIDF